jgi:hypothetical protein
MTNKDFNTIVNFIEEKKFKTRKTDGWSYITTVEAISVSDIMELLKAMTMDEDKKLLLLIDLTSRLPYGVKCRENKLDSQICTLHPEQLINGVERFEPYLRPMSSMTWEEKFEYDAITSSDNVLENHLKEIHWLNTKHFDYRGLIPLGLAIPVTEKNNPYKS